MVLVFVRVCVQEINEDSVQCRNAQYVYGPDWFILFLGTGIERKKEKTKLWLIVLSVLCGPSSLFVSQQLSVPVCSCAIALAWALDLPWGVWVLQHKTVNPPVSWWLLIRYSHPAFCSGEISSGLYSSLSLFLIISPSLCTATLSPAGPHTGMTHALYYAGIRTQLLASFPLYLLSSINIMPPPLFIQQYRSPLFLLSSLWHCVSSASSHPSFSLCHSASSHLSLLLWPVTLVRSLWDVTSALSVITTRRGSSEACSGCVVIPDHDNVCRWVCKYKSSVSPLSGNA